MDKKWTESLSTNFFNVHYFISGQKASKKFFHFSQEEEALRTIEWDQKILILTVNLLKGEEVGIEGKKTSVHYFQKTCPLFRKLL